MTRTSFLKKARGSIVKGIRFIGKESKAFREWREKHHQEQLLKARKHFEEEFKELSRQRAILLMKKELEQQRLEHKMAQQEYKTAGLKMSLEREKLRKELSHLRPKPIKKVLSFAKEVYLGSKAKTVSRPRIKSRNEILAELDRKVR